MKKQIKHMFTVSMVVAGLMCMGSLTHAQQVQEKDWSWRLLPFYGWFTSVSGETGIGKATTELDADFDEIFDHLAFIYMGHFEGVWRQTAGFFVDGIYTKLEGDKTVGGRKTELETTMPIMEGGAFYRLNAGPSSFDLLGGVRYYGLDVDLSVSDLGDASQSSDWFDAIGGLRWIIHVTEKFAISARGDLGFGGSDMSWNAIGLLDWQPWEHFSLVAGYRALGYDYEDDDEKVDFTYDLVLQGPVLGFSIIW